MSNPINEYNMFEDEVDIALAINESDDEEFDEFDDEESIDNEIELDDENIEDEIDTELDYSDEVPEVNDVDMRASDMIAAERDLLADPFEDDDVIDVAIGDEDLEDIEVKDGDANPIVNEEE